MLRLLFPLFALLDASDIASVGLSALGKSDSGSSTTTNSGSTTWNSNFATPQTTPVNNIIGDRNHNDSGNPRPMASRKSPVCNGTTQHKVGSLESLSTRTGSKDSTAGSLGPKGVLPIKSHSVGDKLWDLQSNPVKMSNAPRYTPKTSLGSALTPNSEGSKTPKFSYNPLASPWLQRPVQDTVLLRISDGQAVDLGIKTPSLLERSPLHTSDWSKTGGRKGMQDCQRFLTCD